MDCWQTETRSAGETRALGRYLGQAVAGDTVIFLSGDLGAGKTCLTQGLALGLEVPEDEPVVSPSYTLMNHYHGRFELYHFDLYRLGEPDDLIDLGFDEYLCGDGVKVVEWADRFGKVDKAYAEGLQVQIFHRSEKSRTVIFRAASAAARNLLATLARTWEERE